MPRRQISARRPAVLAALAVAASAAACRELAFEPQDPQTVTYAPSLGIALGQFTRLPSGVYYRDVAVGSGAVVETTSTVGVTYRGYLADGRVFDSTSTTASATIPLVSTVPGFRTGLAGARQGSRRQLIIPPAQGYGNRSTPDNRIPAGSVLFFDLNVNSVTTPVDTTKKTTARAGA
jgi:FKBP-type peptidyl-prolyl cis-trans isomerase